MYLKLGFLFLFLTFPVFSQKLPREFLPLEKIGEGSIKNPYWKEPVWKVWGLDPERVSIADGELKGDYSPLEKSKRLYPSLVEKNGRFEFKLVKEQGSASGLWDDVYLSQDHFHTNLRQHKGQFLLAGKTRGLEKFKVRHQLGVNFTSQSYARRGRHIVDDFMNTLDTERHYFFANTVRCTPAHISFRDNKKEAVEDTYDALFAHSYQSIGQSGSEMHAIYKMMYAGGFIPRDVKNELKRNGIYAPVMLTLFKAALPYTDAIGNPLPFEHEMRHKPAYSSHGTPQHPHYCSANPHFHGYNDNLHLAKMIRLAQNMKTPPPLTLLALAGMSIKKDGEQINDKLSLQEHIKFLTVTNASFWCKPGETIYLRAALTKSFDLKGEKLTFTGKVLYPNQKNVQLKQLAPGVFDIQAKFDPNMPKGRLPVIFTCKNASGQQGNPVFINFYWPVLGEIPDYHPYVEIEKRLQPEYKKRGWTKKRVTSNKRPQFTIPQSLSAVPGQRIRIPLGLTDPEGFPVTVYRREGEPGKVEAGEFILDIPGENYKSVYKIHFHLSDGTGGYTGTVLQIAVTPTEHKLSNGWNFSTFDDGKSSLTVKPGTVEQTGSVFKISGQQPGSGFQASFVSKKFNGKADLILKSVKAADFGLMMSSGLDLYAVQSRLFNLKGEFNHFVRKDEALWGNRTYKLAKKYSQDIQFLRMISTGKETASFVSADGKTWQQICGQNFPLGSFHGGWLYKGTGSAECKILGPDSSIPFIVTKDKAAGNGTYKKLAMSFKSLNEKAIVHYTLDGSEPTLKSAKFEKEIELKKAGGHTIRLISVEDGKITGMTTAVFTVKP